MEDELETLISKICTQMRSYHEIDTLNAFQQFLSAQHPIKTSFISNSGIDFNNKVQRINSFWLKSFMAIQVGQDPFFYSKLISNMIFGDRWHEKLKSTLGSKTLEEEKTREPLESLQFSKKDYNIVGSMFFVLMVGLIEDYLRNLNLEVMDTVEKRIEKNRLGELRNKYVKGSLLNKIWVIFDELGIEEVFVKKILERENCTSFINSFKQLVNDRNRIAHSGKIIDLSDLDYEIDRLSLLLIDFMTDLFDSQMKIARFPKSEYKVIIQKSMPFMVFLFAIYMKVVPLLTILDHCFIFIRNSG
ncbi:MAG: hypothetical protein ACFFFG_17885 [Candidatus Thorarchaeota archaeon]